MIRSYLKSKANKFRDKIHTGLLNACEELKAHKKNPKIKKKTVKVSVKRPIGYKIEYIGAGGKVYKTETDKVWDTYKKNPADKHLAHIRSELKELGVDIEHRKDGYYYVYPASITNKALINKLTVKQRDIHKAWETGKDMVAELARRYLENLEDKYNERGM